MQNYAIYTITIHNLQFTIYNITTYNIHITIWYACGILLLNHKIYIILDKLSITRRIKYLLAESFRYDIQCFHYFEGQSETSKVVSSSSPSSSMSK